VTQPGLFTGLSATVAVETAPFPRKEQIERAHNKVSQEFYDRYERVMMTFYLPFTAEDVTHAYEGRYDNLTLEQKKGIGKLYQDALRGGRIRKTGQHKPRANGNLCAEYEVVR
jgi:hypothetical protein